MNYQVVSLFRQLVMLVKAVVSFTIQSLYYCIYYHLPGPLYVMIPPSSGGAEILQAMQHGQGQRPLMPRLSSDGVV